MTKVEKLNAMIAAQAAVINQMKQIVGAKVFKKSEGDFLVERMLAGQEVVLDGIRKLEQAKAEAEKGEGK